MTVRVVIADDSLLVRNGVERLLADVADIEVVGTADDYDGALQQVDDTRPDLLMTDIRMPPTGTDEGIRLAAALRLSQPDVGVLVLSQYVEPGWALTLLSDGSAGRGYLLKDRVAMPDQLIQAIRDVADHGSGAPPPHACRNKPSWASFTIRLFPVSATKTLPVLGSIETSCGDDNAPSGDPARSQAPSCVNGMGGTVLANVAWTVLSASKVRRQTPVPAQSPDQPTKEDCGSASGRSVIRAPTGNLDARHPSGKSGTQ
jgi:DNA-binding NarL/FixJ family response regulator